MSGVFSPTVPEWAMDIISDSVADVAEELWSACRKHGFSQTPMNPGKSLNDSFVILAEEFGEVARALTHDEGDIKNLQAELIQTAAMAVAMLVGIRGRV